MFKGISKEFKEKLEKFNEETDFFVFNCSDLELGSYENEGEGVYYKTYRKYYLYSNELKQKLNRVIQERKQPGEKIPALRSVFFNRVPPYESALRTLSNSFNW